MKQFDRKIHATHMSLKYWEVQFKNCSLITISFVLIPTARNGRAKLLLRWALFTNSFPCPWIRFFIPKCFINGYLFAVWFHNFISEFLSFQMVDPGGIANWSITHVDWSEGKWHPKAYRAQDVSYELLKNITVCYLPYFLHSFIKVHF